MIERFKSLFARDDLLLRVALLLIAVLPFLSVWRVGPLPSFFLESGSLLFALVMVLLTACSGSLTTKIPVSSWYFMLLAAFWAVQARVMQLPYIALSDMAAWSFVVLALMCWACRGWIYRLGGERAVSVLAGALLLGALLNAAIGWLQYGGAAANFPDILLYQRNVVAGQLAQRNHFAHYLMWGVLCAGWLWSQRRLSAARAAACIVFLAATMALTGSRTVFGYVLAAAILLPAYRLYAGKTASRAVWAMGFAALAVLVCQFAVEPLLNLFRDTGLHSAAERLHGAQLEGSGRGYEWRKAWQIFQAAPWFGHGWGSYPLYGFLTNVYPDGFRPYENGVLFTHSHNSFLNLLAEMGITGTALVLGGLAYSVRGCLKRSGGTEGLLLLLLMSVSLVHSTLEYPLWYIYFLTVFALFVGFAPPAGKRDDALPDSGSLKLHGAVAAVLSLLLAGGIVRLGFAYQQLLRLSDGVPANIVKRTDNIVGLLNIAKTEPMLRYYAQLQLTNYISPVSSTMPDWAEQAARENMQYRPFANAYKYALAAYRAGKIQEARNWMQLMYRYYPAKMSAYAAPIMNTPYYPLLRDDYTAACKAYFAACRQIPECVQPLPDLADLLHGSAVSGH